MEWFYGLLIGSTFTAVLMHLAHRGHKEEREVVKADGTILEKGGFTYQATFPEPTTTLTAKQFLLAQVEQTKAEIGEFRKNVRADLAAHFAKNDVVDTLEDVPTDCTCDWAGDHRFDEAEPRVWYRTMKDEDCPRHRADDGWLRLQLYQERTDR